MIKKYVFKEENVKQCTPMTIEHCFQVGDKKERQTKRRFNSSDILFKNNISVECKSETRKPRYR